MVWLGRYFHAPPARAIRDWWKVELLYEFGERFVAGNTRLGIHASNLRSAIEHLQQQGHLEEEIRLHLARVRERRTPPPAPRRKERRRRRD